MTDNFEYGIFPGRFQPFHNGHLFVVNEYLKNYLAPLIIGIVINRMPIGNNKDFTDFEIQASQHHTNERNPWNFWERFEMINGLLQNHCLKERVLLLPLPRPQGPSEWWSFVKDFLPHKRKWVLPVNEDKFDKAKISFFTNNNEEVILIPEKFEDYNGKKIRDLISNGKPIDNLVPNEIWNYLRKNNDYKKN